MSPVAESSAIPQGGQETMGRGQVTDQLCGLIRVIVLEADEALLRDVGALLHFRLAPAKVPGLPAGAAEQARARLGLYLDALDGKAEVSR